jgi:hypothetical protein
LKPEKIANKMLMFSQLFLLASLDLNALPNGVYYVHIIAANGKLVKKVVLQR